MFRIFISLFTILLITSSAYGWDKSIHIEWGYIPPSDLTVTGFRLYQSGKEVCVFQGADVRQGDCNISLTQTGTPFTLTAVFSDKTESPHSAPFVFSDYGPGPSIIILIGKQAGGQ